MAKRERAPALTGREAMEIILKYSPEGFFTVKELSLWLMETYSIGENGARKRAVRVLKKIPCESISSELYRVFDFIPSTVKIVKSQKKLKEPKALVVNDEEFMIKEIVDYFNKSLDRNYRVNKEITKLINARIKEGFKLDDFKDVIEIKKKEWFGTEMQKYLRPETLFNGKFQSYLNQLEGGSAAQQMANYDFTKYIKKGAQDD